MDAIYQTSPYGWGDGNALAPYVPAGQFGYNKVFSVDDDIKAFRTQLGKDIEWINAPDQDQAADRESPSSASCL